MTVVIQAMEGVVLDDTKGRYARACAWYRLLKLWTGLTHHDAEGLVFGSISLDIKGLTCQVKGVRHVDGDADMVTVYVGDDVYIDRPDWLMVGSLWKRMATENQSTERDYFLQLPARGLEGAQRMRVTYSAAAALPQALFKILTVPGEDGVLLDAGAGSIWSENSERATLRV